ncbi:MAG: glycerate kinase [Phycisphaeraceae bacterium]
MKVVIAPDSFKDALRAERVCEHIARGIDAVAPDVDVDRCPIADGGEGFVAAIAHACGGSAKAHAVTTTDPLGRDISADITIVTRSRGSSVAAIELAAASGLERLGPSERDVVRASTFGSGRLIREALEHRPAHLLLGIGGSATNDAGCGLAQALGAVFYDAAGALMAEPIAGGDLWRIDRIDLGGFEKTPFSGSITVACDVTNPLTGPNGAAHVYAPQKGATPEQVKELDAGLRHMAELWRDQLGIDVEHMPGAGAAGGVGGGLVAMLGAELVPGAELVLDTIGFDERIKDADLVITGEGRLDGQSMQGKAAMTVARRCKEAGVPCVALVGSVGEGAGESLAQGLVEYRVIGEGLSAEESIRRTGELLEDAAATLLRSWLPR